MSEFALDRNSLYISPADGMPPAKTSEFEIEINPVKILEVKFNDNIYARDINGGIVKKDMVNNAPLQIKVTTYINCISQRDLFAMYDYMMKGTRLWLIDGVCGGFRYSGATFNLMLDADKTKYKELPVICGWNGFITDINGDFYSSYKITDNAGFIFEVNGVWAAPSYNGFNTAWAGEGSIL